MAFATNHRFDSPGPLRVATPISVVSASATEHPLTPGRAGIIFQNVGNKECWFGDSTVAPASNLGNILLPRASVMFVNVKSDFSVYFRCAAGDTTTIGIVESE
ncbi:MAG: hypothetical protein ACXABY_27515 [Candidatus Thorarchaeota archaeon]|jgi:hypothetical protein